MKWNRGHARRTSMATRRRSPPCRRSMPPALLPPTTLHLTHILRDQGDAALVAAKPALQQNSSSQQRPPGSLKTVGRWSSFASCAGWCACAAPPTPGWQAPAGRTCAAQQAEPRELNRCWSGILCDQVHFRQVHEQPTARTVVNHTCHSPASCSPHPSPQVGPLAAADGQQAAVASEELARVFVCLRGSRQ